LKHMIDNLAIEVYNKCIVTIKVLPHRYARLVGARYTMSPPNVTKKAIRVIGEVYPSAADSLPKDQQLATKPQFYLTSYRYIGFQSYSPSR